LSEPGTLAGAIRVRSRLKFRLKDLNAFDDRCIFCKSMHDALRTVKMVYRKTSDLMSAEEKERKLHDATVRRCDCDNTTVRRCD
jgi:hypothetical protein